MIELGDKFSGVNFWILVKSKIITTYINFTWIYDYFPENEESYNSYRDDTYNLIYAHITGNKINKIKTQHDFHFWNC